MAGFKKVCCCFELSTAAVLLGWLGAAGYFTFAACLIFELPRGNFNGDIMDVIQIVIILFVMLVSALSLIACVCLMVGTINKNPRLILPWLITEMGFILFLVICFVGLLIECIIFGRSWMFFQVITVFIFLIFQIYVWACVRALYQELRKKEVPKEDEAQSTTPKNNLVSYASLQ